MSRAAVNRRDFERQLREKYLSSASTKGQKGADKTRIVDEDALLNEPVDKEASTITVRPLAERKKPLITDEVDDYETEEDAAFVQQAIRQEMAQQGMDLTTSSERRVTSSENRVVSSEGKHASSEEKLKKETNESSTAKKRWREDDFSSEDEVQRPSRHGKNGHKSPSDAQSKRKETSDHSGDEKPTTTYRDKYGRRITESEWRSGLEDRKRRAEPRKVKQQVEKIPEKDLTWGGGLVQKRLEEEKKKYEEEIAREPFARYEVSASYDSEMKDKTLWEDPMKDILHSTTEKNDHEQDTLKERRKYPAPPNRYHILPGTHWDGKVRGNGFEERYLNIVGTKLTKINERTKDYSYATD